VDGRSCEDDFSDSGRMLSSCIGLRSFSGADGDFSACGARSSCGGFSPLRGVGSNCSGSGNCLGESENHFWLFAQFRLLPVVKGFVPSKCLKGPPLNWQRRHMVESGRCSGRKLPGPFLAVLVRVCKIRSSKGDCIGLREVLIALSSQWRCERRIFIRRLKRVL